MGNSAGSSATEVLAARLKNDLIAFNGTRLPSCQILAKRYGVAPQTMLKAAHVLREQGILRFSQGQPMYIAACDTGLNVAQPRLSSAEKLADTIARQIAQGHYAPGTALPKAEALCLEHAVSGHTVSGALKLLAAEGSVHRRGKRWIAGPQPGRTIAVHQQRPVILILQRKLSSWRDLGVDSRTSQFFHAFTGECDSHGIDTISVFPEPLLPMQGLFAFGFEQIVSTCRALGERYLGTLVVTSQKELPDLDDWLLQLQTLGKPVVWFDRNDEGLEMAHHSRLISRCHFSEIAAVNEAAQALILRGHSRAAHAILFRESWRKQRMELLAAQHELTVSVYPRMQWESMDAPSCAAVVNFLLQRYRTSTETRRFCAAVFSWLRLHQSYTIPIAWNTVDKIVPAMDLDRASSGPDFGYFQTQASILPGVYSLLADSQATAFIASNDFDAVRVLLLLRSLGYLVPEHYSLIGFDNEPRVHPVRVSTIDMGFGNLGHAAFHLIRQRMPVKRDSNGNVPACPRFIDRGTVRSVA